MVFSELFPTPSRIRLLAAGVVLTCVCTVAAVAEPTRHLDLDPLAAPYEFKCIKVALQAKESDNVFGYSMCDIDGDGMGELVVAESHKLMGWDCEDGYIKPSFQHNLAFEYYCDVDPRELTTCYDLDGDGVEEIYFTVRTTDYAQWRFMVLDPARDQLLVDAPLPVGEDRRRDPHWDGSYYVAGVLTDSDGRGRPGAVLVRVVQYDAEPRGILVVDPRTGETIWEWISGSQPAVGVQVVDLENDGLQEIVIYGHSPDNLGGRLVNGISDDHSWLFVLSHTGEVLWQELTGPAFNGGEVRTADLDGDGIREIITFTSTGASNQTNKLTVWNWPERRVQAQKRADPFFYGLAILPGPRPATSWLITGSNDGMVNRYLYENGSLVRDGRILFDESLVRVAREVEVIPEVAGPEVPLNLGVENRLVLLNGDLDCLAVMVRDPKYAKLYPEVWPRLAERVSLVVGSVHSWWVLDVERRPLNAGLWLMRIGVGILALGALAGMFIVGRLVGQRRGIPALGMGDPEVPADREQLYRLLRQLDDMDHSVVGAAKGLKRLIWLLDVYAEDLGSSDELAQRIEQVLADFGEAGYPRLFEALRLASSVGFEPETVKDTSRLLNSLALRLQNMAADGLEVSRVAGIRDELRSEWDQVKTGFLVLRTAVREYFTTDPVRMLRGMFLVREVELQRQGISAEIVEVPDDEQAACLIDSADLAFVLDNLLDNATRALAGRELKRLILAVERNGAEVIVRVSDSGAGIEDSLRERVFSGRFSTRAGGGTGLYRSRELLGNWGSEILLSDSAPGQGTTFIVKLLAARDEESVESLRSEA